MPASYLAGLHQAEQDLAQVQARQRHRLDRPHVLALFLPATFPSAGPGHAPTSPAAGGRKWAGSVRGAALVSAGVRQPQVEEHVLAHQVAPAGGAESASQALGPGILTAGRPPGDGGDEQLQPVEAGRTPRKRPVVSPPPSTSSRPGPALAQGGDDAGRGELAG